MVRPYSLSRCACSGLGICPLFEIFVGERVIRREHTVLHRHVQAARRFAAARYADQDDLRLIVVIDARAVVVFHRVIDRGDTLLIAQFGVAAVAAADGECRIWR